ncbi:MAG: MBL fold metallo-hydrolase [Pirellulales bacterium]|nr:MBL fold metallo-hydrolase [Pirellulales bacterium]
MSGNAHRWRAIAWLAAGAIAVLTTRNAWAQLPLGLSDFALSGNRLKEATRVNEAIYYAPGFSNTFLVVTSDGNVVIDTSSALSASKHHELLQKISSAPVRYLILTHGHDDHTGGVSLWKGPETKLLVQARFPEFRQYQQRLAGYFIRSNAAQFALDEKALNAFAHRPENRIEPDVVFDRDYQFSLGGLDFEVHAAPGETYDHLFVWLPKYKAAFVGDNFYDSFPNIYTLRGTRPRWALDYIAALDQIIALEPEILLPSHGAARSGKEQIHQALTRYRSAIRYVHDAVVQGMNDGKDVFTLMQEIKLPADLDVGEAYGKVDWSVRGIYEGYVGWFDQNPASMYDQSPTAGDVELARLAGGPDKIVTRAQELIASGQAVVALRLIDAALALDNKHQPAWQARLDALKVLQKQSRNLIELAWLSSSVKKAKQALGEK